MEKIEEKRYLKWYNKVGYGSGDVAGNVVYAFLFGGIYYAVLCIIFMIFQCIDPFINKENYLAKDLVLLLLDFELELPTSNKEPEDNIQQIKQERIEQGANQ